MEDTLLRIDDLCIQFKTEKKPFNAVDGVSFSMKQGEILGVVGESGCGKSITSLSIMKLLPRTSKIVRGEIWFQDKLLNNLPEEQMRNIRGNEISMIFQEPMTSLNPVYRVGRQMSEPLMLHKGLSFNDAKEVTLKMMNNVGLKNPEQVYNQYPHELSGGMRQRIMITMGLVCQPKLLIADEPTTALDVTIQAQILELMKDINRDMGTAILIISHDIGVIAELCSQVVVMYAGEICERAQVRELFKSPRHPYTVGLMESIPTPDRKGKPLSFIKGTVPSAQEQRQGCSFASRCPYAMDICTKENPPINEISPGHYVKCFALNGDTPTTATELDPKRGGVSPDLKKGGNENE